MKKLILLLTLFLLYLPFKSLAWGKEGHHIIAEVAYKYLSPTAKANVVKYLNGTTFDEASVWMDEMRSNHSYDYMKPWHYINIEKGENYIQNSEENVVNEILSKEKELSNLTNLTPEQIRTDLLVLFHLIGDIHQPLHVGYGIDKGGNTVQVNFLGEGTNLHAIWDSKIIVQQNITLDDCLELISSLTANQVAAIKKNNVVGWMTESRSYLEDIYNFTGHVLGVEYAQKNRGTIVKQLAYGGLRLAAVLEQYFGNNVKIPQNSTPIPLVKGNNTITVDEASNHIGETLTVCGKVFGGKYLENSNGKPTLINMGASYPNNSFTLVIFGDTRVNFSYTPEEYLNNKNICVTGLIKMFKGKPEIVVSNESQITTK